MTNILLTTLRILKIFLLIMAVTLLTLSAMAIEKVSIDQTETGYKFVIDGQPTPIKGVTWGMPIDPATIGAHMDTLVAMGVNSVRLWGTGTETQILLDACAEHNISVLMGLWMRHGRPGMEGDDNFQWETDVQGREDQFKDTEKWVTKYKDHPAVLGWGVGNEVILNCPDDASKLAYVTFLQRVCTRVKELDPNHPVLSVSAWSISWEWWRDHVPALDGYGINSYGPGVNAIAGMKKEMGIKQPYVITEYGPVGEWDVQTDKNGVKLEPDDQTKYQQIVNNYKSAIKDNPDCLGVYSFNYGEGWDFGSTWLNFFNKGAHRPGYWATRECYTGKKPLNAIPEVKISLPVDQVKSGEWIDVDVDLYDADGDDLTVEFHCNLREGARLASAAFIECEHRLVKGKYQVKMPHLDGGVKLYCFAKDTYPNISMGYTSMTLESTGKFEAQAGQYGSMPFYVYKDQGAHQNHFTPSGYMGNAAGLTFDDGCTEAPYEGKSCIKITYSDKDDWWGLAWQDPANDWGAAPGGFNLKDAKKLVFYVKGDRFGVDVKFGVGMIGQDATYYDTVIRNTGDQIVTTKKWRKYEIYLKNDDKSRIKTGLVMYGAGEGLPYTIYVDNVHFE